MKRALLILMLLTATADADDREAAKKSYLEGTRLYDIADYKAALEAFKKAYLNFEDPILLFNIAQCYRQLDDKPEAVRFYKTFVRKAPRSPNTEEARRLIGVLEAAMAKPVVEAHAAPSPQPVIAQRAQAPSPAPAAKTVAATQPAPGAQPLVATAAPVSERRPVYKKWWFWTATVLAAGVVATAIGVGVTEGRAHEPSYQVHAP